MKAIRHIAILLLYFSILYGVVFLFAFIKYPPPDVLNSQHADETLFKSEPRYLYIGRLFIQRNKKGIILIGPSTVREGFLPEIISKTIIDYDIHNISIGASNITQMKQAIMLLKELQTTSSFKNSIFVIGTGFQSFKENSSEDESDLEHEMRKFGFHNSGSTAFKNPTSPAIQTAIAYLYYPLFFIDNSINYKIMNPSLNDIRELVSSGKTIFLNHGKTSSPETLAWTPPKSREEREKVIVSESIKEEAISHWMKYIGSADGTVPEEQFEELNDLVDYFEKNGGNLMVVDMPAPQWMQEMSPNFLDYQKRKLRVIQNIEKSKHIKYLNFQNMNDSFGFYDSGHPKYSYAIKISKRLANEIMKFTSGSEGK